MTGSQLLSENEGGEPDDVVRKIGQEIFQVFSTGPLPSLKIFKGASEKIYLSELIRQCGGEISRILSISGLSCSHFHSFLKKFNLSIHTDATKPSMQQAPISETSLFARLCSLPRRSHDDLAMASDRVVLFFRLRKLLDESLKVPRTSRRRSKEIVRFHSTTFIPPST